MVIAYHVILGMYGFWLSNDERGSWSDFIGSWELLRFGRATSVKTRRSLANQPFDPVKRAQAKASLKYPPVRLTGVQARAIGDGFAQYVHDSGLVIHACAVLPEHVHLVVGRFRSSIEQAVVQLKAAGTRQLVAQAVHPLDGYAKRSGRLPKVFSRGLWKVFLDHPNDVWRSIRYVCGNPRRENLPEQTWRCVQPYRG